MKYVCAALCAALLVMGWLYRSANNELADTKTSLAVALEANETNQEAIVRLERSIGNTNEVLAKWNEDRTTLAEVRSATRQAIGQAVRNHVQRCFDVRDAKFAAVAVLATPKAVADWLTANLATDWPE